MGPRSARPEDRLAAVSKDASALIQLIAAGARRLTDRHGQR